MRARMVKGLRSLHAIPVENPVHPGTPDFNCTLGWVELKWLRSWPKGRDTVVRIKHFTPQQRRWLRKRWFVDKSAWLLLQVGREYLLFNGAVADAFVGKVSRERLIQLSYKYWKHGMRYEELMRCLRNLGA